jgi:hypothetical protein
MRALVRSKMAAASIGFSTVFSIDETNIGDVVGSERNANGRLGRLLPKLMETNGRPNDFQETLLSDGLDEIIGDALVL